MNGSSRLQNIAVWRREAKLDRTVQLGTVAEELMDRQILPRLVKFGDIADIWSQLLPVELGRHCRLEGVTRGQLTVLVDSSCYMYELQLCSSKLLEQLQRQCPRAQIEKIRFSLG